MTEKEEPEYKLYQGKDMYENYLTEGFYWGEKELGGLKIHSVAGGIYKREKIKGMVRFDESLSMGEDTTFNYELFIRYTDNLKVGILKRVFYYYRRDTDENSRSRNDSEKIYLDHVVQKLTWLKLLEKCDICDSELMHNLFNILTFRLYGFFDRESEGKKEHQKMVMDVWRNTFKNAEKRKLLFTDLEMKFKLYYGLFYICPNLAKRLYSVIDRGSVNLQ
ncbi:MAG: hypothetical protein NC489_44285 [Ruminococcus flavefaciens]|nr:hypothetical protein [Ruminococcus flavefaciens]